MHKYRGYLFVLGATLFWGTAATVAKFLFLHQVDMLVLVQMRMTLSCILLLAFFLLFRRDFLRIDPKDLWRFALLGIVGIAGSNFTYYGAIRATNVATAILLQYMAPLLVLAYAAAAKTESLSFVKVAAAFISLAGCFLAVGGIGGDGIAVNSQGLFYGIAAAFCWAFTNVMLGKLLARYRVWTVILYAFICASLFWQFFNPVWSIAAAGYSFEEWRTFLIVAIISILIPHSLYITGAQYLTPTRSIITATFEPTVAIVSAYLVLGETLSPLRIVGAVLVVAAIVLLQYQQEPPVAEEMQASIPAKE